MTKWKTAITKLITTTKHKDTMMKKVLVFSRPAMLAGDGQARPIRYLPLQPDTSILGIFPEFSFHVQLTKYSGYALRKNLSSFFICLPFFCQQEFLTQDFFLCFLETTVSLKRDGMINCQLSAIKSEAYIRYSLQMDQSAEKVFACTKWV